ncbi:MAG: hypothetical protein GY849_03685 [Deltaproteobacteria bacterium]|nr:hypothetical protein [Deltaproteobacteria bacterium]
MTDEKLPVEQADDMVSGAIEDYLLSLADSLQQAQRQLSLMKLPAQPGQPSITYQIPKLDFEFKMSMEMSKSTQKGEDGKEPAMALRARPAGQQDSSSQSTSVEAASTIRGSFVAVPSEGGKPPPVITVSLKRISARLQGINVHIRTAVNEDLAGIDVHFNVDRDLSSKLNSMEGIIEWRPKDDVTLTDVVELKEGLDLKKVVSPEATDLKDVIRLKMRPTNLTTVRDYVALKEGVTLKEGLGLNDILKLKDGVKLKEDIYSLRGWRPLHETDLWDGVVPTNAEGMAANNLKVHDEEPVGAHVAVIIDVLGETETVIFKVEG